MSLETWKQEFYPVGAGEAALVFDKDTPHGKLALIDHAIKKWEGLRPEALQEHGLAYGPKVVWDTTGSGVKLQIDAGTCSLCEAYASHCSRCLLKDCHQEFTSWARSARWGDGNPEPMLALLNRVRKEISDDLDAEAETEERDPPETIHEVPPRVTTEPPAVWLADPKAFSRTRRVSGPGPAYTSAGTDHLRLVTVEARYEDRPNQFVFHDGDYWSWFLSEEIFEAPLLWIEGEPYYEGDTVYNRNGEGRVLVRVNAHGQVCAKDGAQGLTLTCSVVNIYPDKPLLFFGTEPRRVGDTVWMENGVQAKLKGSYTKEDDTLWVQLDCGDGLTTNTPADRLLLEPPSKWPTVEVNGVTINAPMKETDG